MEKVAEDFEALLIFNMLKELDKTTKLDGKRIYGRNLYVDCL